MVRFFNISLALCVWNIFIIYSKCDVTPVDCSSNEFCNALPPKDSPDVNLRCRESELGNGATRKVCSVEFTMKGNEANEMELNPNPGRCTPRKSDKSTKACNDMVRTYSPFSGSINGKNFTRCYSNPKSYFCVVGQRTYVACSVVGTPCSKCPSKN